MGARITEDGAICRMHLDGEMSVATAAELAIVFNDVIHAHPLVEIDLGQVELVDTAGLQLMLMAKRCPGHDVRFINHSAAVLAVLELANLGGQLGDPLLIPAGA